MEIVKCSIVKQASQFGTHARNKKKWKAYEVDSKHDEVQTEGRDKKKTKPAPSDSEVDRGGNKAIQGEKISEESAALLLHFLDERERAQKRNAL